MPGNQAQGEANGLKAGALAVLMRFKNWTRRKYRCLPARRPPTVGAATFTTNYFTSIPKLSTNTTLRASFRYKTNREWHPHYVVYGQRPEN